MPKLAIRNIEKLYRKRPLLTDIKLDCSTQEIIAVFGRNGSGKTTMMQILFGTKSAHMAEVYIDSNPIDLKEGIRKKRIAYLPQDSYLPKDLTVYRVILIYFGKERGQKLLAKDYRLSKLQFQSVGSLSSGERRYLEVFLVCNVEHEFLLLDEPFSLIEPLYKEAIKEMLIKTKADKGIILTDHYYQDASDVADRSVLLKDGQLIEIQDFRDLENLGYIPSSKV